MPVSRGFGKNSNIISRGFGNKLGDIIVGIYREIINFTLRLGKNRY